MHLQVATSGEAVGGSRYRTLGRLGSGGMAEVDLALQTGVAGSSRLCVLKRVRRDLAGRQEFVSMFFEEARISASLNHPNIVQIYEVGGDEQDCFLAMEFLRGRSYAHLASLGSGEILAYRVDLEVMLATLAGLEHAHQRRDLAGQPMRLVHRDISPPNLFVTYEGEIKVLDFGVAKSKNSQIQTEAGILKGKAAYMAPEVVAGDAFDARADLYAVGVMLWEATAGCDRWPGMNDMAILGQLARGGPVKAPGAAARGLPARADELCSKALAAEPSARYQNAAEFRDDLLELCSLLGGRLGQAQLAAYMQRHFSAERLREEREVAAALRPEAATPSFNPSGDTDVGGFTKRVRRSSERPVSPNPAATPVPRKSRSHVWLGAVVILLLGFGIAKLLLPRKEASLPAATAKGPSTEPVSSAKLVLAASAQAVPVEQPAANAESVRAEREPLAKPGSKARNAAAPRAPATSKPAASRGLELDRQDPWQK